MKVLYNKLIPFKGFSVLNFYGILFSRVKNISERTYNHENIHTHQMKDFCKFLPIGGTIFYILYILEWLILMAIKRTFHTYKMISFEKEAYENDRNLDYLKTRPKYALWIN